MNTIAYLPAVLPDAHMHLMQMIRYVLACDGMKQTRWVSAISPEPLDMAPGIETDALMHYVFEWFGSRYGVSRNESRGLTFDKGSVNGAHVWSLPNEVIKTKFSLVNENGRIYAFIAGNEDFSGEYCVPWRNAVEQALLKIKEGHSVHEWQASLFATRFAGMAGVIKRIQNKILLGELSLNPCLYIYRPGEDVHRFNYSGQTSSDIVVVNGKSKAHDDNATVHDARKQVHKLCAVLSLATDDFWSPKDLPLPKKYRNLESLLPKIEAPDTYSATSISHSNVDVNALNDLWLKFNDHPEVDSILSSYYESMALLEKHPSFALVGFVSVIEQIGKLLFDQQTTEKCLSCNRPLTNGSKARFRKALGLVVPPDRVKDVSDRLYSWRSSTAHTGKTFFWERSFGGFYMGVGNLSPNPESLFLVQGFTHAQEIARDLLIYFLNKPLDI